MNMRVEFDANDFFSLFFKDFLIHVQTPHIEYEGKQTVVCDEEGYPYVFAKYHISTFNGYEDFRLFKQDLESIKNRIRIEIENLILENPSFFNDSYWPKIELKFNTLRNYYNFQMVDVDNVVGDYLYNAHFKNVGVLYFLDEVDGRYIQTTQPDQKIIWNLRKELVQFTNPILFLIDELKAYTKRIFISSSELNRKIGAELKGNRISLDEKNEFKEMVSLDELYKCIEAISGKLNQMPTTKDELIMQKRMLTEVEKMQNQSLVNYDTYKLEKNKIAKGLLAIIDKM